MGQPIELGTDDIEVRPVTDADLDALVVNDLRAFGVGEIDPHITRRVRDGGLELDRFVVAVDDGDLVGNAGAFSFDLTLPGGATVPACGTTWVAVSATHRRRGLMRRMLDRLHGDAVARGEVAAVLWAAEASIYGNLGYGPTHQQRICSIDTRRVRFRDDAPGSGTVRYVDAATAREVLPDVARRAARQRPGGLAVREGWWLRMFLRLETAVTEKVPPSVLVHRDDDGVADGFAIYTSEERWDAEVGRHKVEVEMFEACTPDAHAGLWRVLCSLDLVAEIETDQIAVDDPLPWMLVDSRAVRTPFLTDGMWLKVLDVPGVFGARTYATPDVVVVEAGELGRWALGGAARCVEAAGDAPDLSMSPVELGALSLGGTPVGPLVAAGRVVEHTDGAAERFGRALAADPLPYCTVHF